MALGKQADAKAKARQTGPPVRKRVTGRIAVIVKDGDEQIIALTIARKAQVRSAVISPLEHQEIETSVTGPKENDRRDRRSRHGRRPCVEDVGIAARAAAQIIIATPAVQHIAGAGADVGVGLVQRSPFKIDHRKGHAEAVPH